MIFDGLNIAASSLKTHQKAMDVVAHNIANVNTAGYSRQTPGIVTVTPDNLGGLSFGRGVELQSVRRLVDPIINGSILKNGEQQAFWSTVKTGLNTVENVFGSLQSTGLASALDEFFLAWQQLANNPQDTAQKMNVRARSTTIASNMNNMRQQLSDAQGILNIEIDNSIAQVNQLLDSISDLTTQINRQEGSLQGITGMANDLRDQRDQATRELARLIPIRKITTGNNDFLIQSTGGDLLVQDNVSRHLSRGTIAVNGFTEIVVAETGMAINGLAQGGKIGGLIELRDNKLSGYIQDIDSIAANLIFAVNQVHSSGASNVSSFVAGQDSNAALALNDAAQTAPFAGQIQNGSFKVHVYDATGTATPVGGTSITITAGTTTMNDVVTDLNAIVGITASIDSTGHLIISADAGNTVALSDDNSNMLAAFELNAFFHGADAGSLSLSASIQSNADNINTGTVDSATSAIFSGDNSSALAILALQDTAMSVDGTVSASLHSRTSTLSTSYGIDVSNVDQQDRYRTAEADSLSSQRQAISGVNIDEELVSMIKFQRAYEAAAKIISTTNQMLDSLMGLIR